MERRSCLGEIAGLVGSIVGLAQPVGDSQIQVPDVSAQVQVQEKSGKVDWRNALPETVNSWWRESFSDEAIKELDSGELTENQLMFWSSLEGKGKIGDYFLGTNYEFSVYDPDSKVKPLTEKEVNDPNFKRTLEDWVKGTKFEKEHNDVLIFSQITERTAEQAKENGGGYADCRACGPSVSYGAASARWFDKHIPDLKIAFAYFVVGSAEHPSLDRSLWEKAIYKSMFTGDNQKGTPVTGLAVYTKGNGWEVVDFSLGNGAILPLEEVGNMPGLNTLSCNSLEKLVEKVRAENN